MKTIHSPLADQLGQIKAQIAALAEREAEIKTALIALGADAIEGDAYRVTVGDSVRYTLDKGSVVFALGQDWVDDHSTPSHATIVKCSARKSSPVKIAA